MSTLTELTARILNNDRTSMRKSRYLDADAFYLGTREIAHFHADNEMDIRISKRAIKRMHARLIDDPRVSFHESDSEWIVVNFNNDNDLDLVVELIELAVSENATTT